MAEVTIRDLRNHGGDVVKRVLAGETLVVTRSGDPVAELHPVHRPAMTASALLDRWKHLPRVDPAALRSDMDVAIDPSL